MEALRRYRLYRKQQQLGRMTRTEWMQKQFGDSYEEDSMPTDFKEFDKEHRKAAKRMWREADPDYRPTRCFWC